MFEHDYKNYPELTNAQLADAGFSSPHPQITSDFDADVIKVHDGDTVTLRVDFRDFDFPLRFAGIDAPELNAGGEEAREWLKARIEGRRVRILVDLRNRVGKYGRLLGSVFFNGLNIGSEMVYLGLVKPFGRKNEGQVPSYMKLFDLRQWF